MFAVFRDNSTTFPVYELFMQNDINTKGSTQWFNLKVSNKIRIKAKFRILNFVIFCFNLVQTDFALSNGDESLVIGRWNGLETSRNSNYIFKK